MRTHPTLGPTFRASERSQCSECTETDPDAAQSCAQLDCDWTPTLGAIVQSRSKLLVLREPTTSNFEARVSAEQARGKPHFPAWSHDLGMASKKHAHDRPVHDDPQERPSISVRVLKAALRRPTAATPNQFRRNGEAYPRPRPAAHPSRGAATFSITKCSLPSTGSGRFATLIT
jgi:hypothetical protein